MEVLARKPSSNVSDIVHRFAKVCRLKSLGVFSNEKVEEEEEGSESTEEAQWLKIYPQPNEEENVLKPNQDMVAVLMLKLFDTISTLKLAYIQLQQAHLPFNPKKIQLADDLIVSELKTLGDIKKSYKIFTKPKSSLSASLLLELIHDHATQLENLQCQLETKDLEILSLQQELEGVEVVNANLVEKVNRKSSKQETGRFCEEGLSDTAFVNAFGEASKAIHDFAKPLISMMKASKWDLDLAANSIESSIVYRKRSHKKYVFEAYISRRMFHDFSLQAQIVDDITRLADPLDALIQYPNSSFAKFCRLKYLLVVHSKMELSFFGNLDQRKLVIQGGHPRTLFYQAFVRMAKWVWLLGVISGSIDPKAEMFGVDRGNDFSANYMENVVEDENTILNGPERLKVGFMVMPGFRVGCNVIKSRVYLSRISNFY
ncbi:hypothetical protein ACHQM5_020509 [Ranunculus cassubicifolius]